MNRVRAQYKQTVLERLERRSKANCLFLSFWHRSARFNRYAVDDTRAIDAAEAKRARRIARNKRLAGEVV